MRRVYGASKIEVEYETDNRAKYVIEGEDHTLGALLEKVLSDMDGVKTVYYEVPHPLENRIILYVATDGRVKPRDAVKEAIRRILEMNREFTRLYIEAVKEKGVDVSEWV